MDVTQISPSSAMIRKFKMQVPPNNCFFLVCTLTIKDKKNYLKNLQTSIDPGKTLIMSDLQRLFIAAAVDAGFFSSVPVQCWVISVLNDFAINNEQQQHPKDRLKLQFSLQREKGYPKFWQHAMAVLGLVMGLMLYSNHCHLFKY